MSLSEEAKRRLDGFIRKMPKGEEDWNCELSSITGVEDLCKRLTLDAIGPETKWEQIFWAYEHRLGQLAENDAEFLAMVAIATGDVALQQHQAKTSLIGTTDYSRLEAVVFSGIRSCLRKRGSKGKLDSRDIKQHIRAVRCGIRLTDQLAGCLESRAYELPHHGA